MTFPINKARKLKANEPPDTLSTLGKAAVTRRPKKPYQNIERVKFVQVIGTCHLS